MVKKGDIVFVPGKNTKAQIVRLELIGKKRFATVILYDGTRVRFEVTQNHLCNEVEPYKKIYQFSLSWFSLVCLG